MEILLSIRRTRPCQGRLAAVVPLHDKKRHQGTLRVPLLTTPLGLPLRLTDYWQMIALGKQYYRACEFGVKTAVLLVRSKCVRQTELVECGLNSLVRQQYGCKLLREWCRQFPLKLVSKTETSVSYLEKCKP